MTTINVQFSKVFNLSLAGHSLNNFKCIGTDYSMTRDQIYAHIRTAQSIEKKIQMQSDPNALSGSSQPQHYVHSREHLSLARSFVQWGSGKACGKHGQRHVPHPFMGSEEQSAAGSLWANHISRWNLHSKHNLRSRPWEKLDDNALTIIRLAMMYTLQPTRPRPLINGQQCLSERTMLHAIASRCL